MNAVATREYELVYIISPNASEQEVADVHAQVEGIVSRFKGQIARTENWGRRKLAYEIHHHKEGTYVLEVIDGSGEMVKELDRRLKVIDPVIRHLIIRVDEELRVAERRAMQRKESRVRRRVARGLPPEPESTEAAPPAPEGRAGRDEDRNERGDSEE